MALTWRNVDAPNLSGIGSLMGSAFSGMNDAFDNLRSIGSNIQNDRASRYSQEVLAKAAGITDPDQIGSYIQGASARDMTPEALELLMRQRGRLLDEQMQRTRIGGLEADQAYTANTRQGAEEAAQALFNARGQMYEGDLQGAHAAGAGLTNPYAIRSFLGGTENAPSIADSSISVDNSNYNRGRSRDSDRRSDAAANAVDQLYARGGIHDMNQGQIAVDELYRQGEINEQQRTDMLAEVGRRGDEALQRFNEDLVDQIPVGELEDQINTILPTVQRDIENQISANPLSQYDEYKSQVESVVGDGPINMTEELADQLGISHTGWLFGPNMGDRIERIAKGSGRTQKEILALALSSREGGIFNSNNQNIDVNDAIQEAKNIFDPANMDASRKQLTDLQNILDNVTKNQAKAERGLERMMRGASVSGSFDSDEYRTGFSNRENAQRELLNDLTNYYNNRVTPETTDEEASSSDFNLNDFDSFNASDSVSLTNQILNRAANSAQPNATPQQFNIPPSQERLFNKYTQGIRQGRNLPPNVVAEVIHRYSNDSQREQALRKVAQNPERHINGYNP